MAQKIIKRSPIIFIHGSGGGGWEWKYWADYFALSGWKCYCPTLRGGGKNNLANVTFKDYLEELEKLIRGLPQKPILVGVSMGGMLAQKLAETGKTQALILVNSVPPKGVASEFWPADKYINLPAVIRWSSESTLADTKDCMPEADRKTILWAHSQWRDESGKVIRELWKGIKINKNRVKCPVLVIAGEKDTDIIPTVSREISKFYHADYIEFTGVSHVGALLGKRYLDIASGVKTWIEKL